MSLKVNRRELARVLSVDMNTITAYVDRGMPVDRPGSRGVPWTFDVAACVRWRLDYELAQHASRSTKDIDREEAERRLVIADATLKEIRVAEAMRAVVKVEDVSRIWEGRIVASRETFQGIAARLAPILVGEQDQATIEEHIDREIERALNELATWEPEDLEDDGDDAGGDEPED